MFLTSLLTSSLLMVVLVPGISGAYKKKTSNMIQKTLVGILEFRMSRRASGTMIYLFKPGFKQTKLFDHVIKESWSKVLQSPLKYFSTSSPSIGKTTSMLS